MHKKADAVVTKTRCDHLSSRRCDHLSGCGAHKEPGMEGKHNKKPRLFT